MVSTDRRYDIDWLRVIAIAFLLIYHIAIVFQPWGVFIGFIQSADTSATMWIPMALLNVFRIPLLFFVSGMGLCFAMRSRNWKQLLTDRAKRILLPLVFGSIFIVPIHVYIFQKYYEQDISYSVNMGHLWFLANICIYVLQCMGLFFLDKNFDYKIFNAVRRMLKRPYMIYLFMIPFILEAVLVDPDIFSLYVGTGHGFVLGMIAFFFGFIFVAIGNEFTEAILKLRNINLVLALGLYLLRYFNYDLAAPNYLMSIESISWIFAAFGFAYKYLNRPSKVLTYLSRAVYPVYIIHMVFLYLAAYFILPMEFSLEVKFIFIVLLTFIGCFGTYELFIRRLKFIRPMFGLKLSYE